MDPLSNLNKDRKTKRKSTLDLSTMVYGRVPPQARDIEKAILGAILLNKNSYELVSELLQPDDFYVDAHQRIFKAMQMLAKKNQPIDELTCAQELLRAEELELIGGPYYLTMLTKDVVSSANIESHSRYVKEKAVARNIIRVSGELIGMAYEDSTDVFELAAEAETLISKAATGLYHNDFKHISSGVDEVVREVDYLIEHPGEFLGITSGNKDLDRITLGWQDTDLIVLAARPGMGKTAMALNWAYAAATCPKSPVGVGFFSLEMSKKQISQRLLTISSRVMFTRIREGRMEDPEHYTKFKEQGVQVLNKLPIFVDDTAGLNVFEFKAKAKRLVQRHGVKIIFVDYLQLMTDGSRGGVRYNREQEVATISKTLKATAKELGIPIIALCQISREADKRKEGLPTLADLRESGAIEQDADGVFALWRPSKEDVKKDPSLDRACTLKNLKYRNGLPNDCYMKWYGEIQTFMNSDQAHQWEGTGNYKPMPKIGDLFEAKKETIKPPITDIDLPE